MIEMRDTLTLFIDMMGGQVPLSLGGYYSKPRLSKEIKSFARKDNRKGLDNILLIKDKSHASFILSLWGEFTTKSKKGYHYLDNKAMQNFLPENLLNKSYLIEVVTGMNEVWGTRHTILTDDDENDLCIIHDWNNGNNVFGIFG